MRREELAAMTDDEILDGAVQEESTGGDTAGSTAVPLWRGDLSDSSAGDTMSAQRGWIADPPPDRERTPPSHRYKWYKMMGATDLLPKTQHKGDT